MKKFFKPSICISILMCLLIISVSMLSVFLSQQKIETKGEITQNKKDYAKYFKKHSIDQTMSTYFNLYFHTNKDKILWNFTNWTTQNSNLLRFEKEKISDNILFFISQLLNQHSKFNSTEALYINIKYDLANASELTIDVRWANVKALQAQKDVVLFWEMKKINLS